MIALRNLAVLKAHLCSKAGYREVDTEACEQLSILIYLHENHYVSSITLMQLFGILPHPSQVFPCRVIQMLCDYAGCCPYGIQYQNAVEQGIAPFNRYSHRWEEIDEMLPVVLF